MMKRILILILCVALVPRVNAAELPDLGDVSAADLSPLAERKLGESIMREMRARDPAYLDDPEVEDYVSQMGRRLALAGVGAEQDFQFFVIRDATLNAFALPGGFIGVHTGLILAAESESELASVLGHEIAHVTQRHIAQLFGKQGQTSMMMLASLLVAVLAARSNSQISEAAIVAGQAGAMQAQLAYTRGFEREADRLGLQTLEKSGYDVRGMPAFFERLQRANRLYESNAPSYLRTHPLTAERISDMENRVSQLAYRQVPDSPDFALVKTKLKVAALAGPDAVREYEGLLARNGADPSVRYGLARALFAVGRFAEAEGVLKPLRSGVRVSVLIEALAADLRLAQNDADGAIAVLESAARQFPESRAVRYARVEALLRGSRAREAAALARANTQVGGGEPKMWGGLARAEAAQGKRASQHRAQAEVYALGGAILAAIEQLELARRAGDGDFYELSAVDARLRELKEIDKQRRLEKRGADRRE